jgi:hypothetical protein
MEMWQKTRAEMIEEEMNQDLTGRQMAVPHNRHLSDNSESDVEFLGRSGTPPPLPGSHLSVRGWPVSGDKAWWDDHWYTASWRGEEQAGRSAHYGVKLDRAREFLAEFVRLQGRGDPADWFKAYDVNRLDRRSGR